MVKVSILQTDNRPTLNYLLLTQKVNQKICDYFGYTYVFIEFENTKYGNIHPATKKIYIINEFLQESDCDIMVFLDSDAWTQNGCWLDSIIHHLVNEDTKHGCFSRDPYLKKNTFINSGSFILKNNGYTKKMYENLIYNLEHDSQFHNHWPYDQYYISNYIFENKDDFYIFQPDVLNTPLGKVLRHNWFKNRIMIQDLQKICNLSKEDIVNNNVTFHIGNHYDTEIFPNIAEKGYEYRS
jgi:hypothetical protein